MGANTVPRFVEVPKIWQLACSQVNTGVDGSGSFQTLVTGGANGSKVDLFTFRAAEGIVANTLRIFLETSGGTDFLYEEITFSLTTIAVAGVEGANDEFQPTFPIIVPSGYKLVCAVHAADIINVFAHGGDY